MHYIVLIQYTKSLNDLPEVGESCPFRELSLLFQNLFKITTVAVFVDEVKIVDCF